MRRRPVTAGLSGDEMAIGLFNCFYSRPIQKISQEKGLRDQVWVPLSPLLY